MINNFGVNAGWSTHPELAESMEQIAGRPLTLGGLIASIRLGEKRSQTAFARKLDVSPSHLCDIEKGRKVVSPERAAQFAQVLGRSPEQFARLSLQELIDEAGLKMMVNIDAA